MDDLKKDIGDIFKEEFAQKYLKDRLYNFIFSENLQKTEDLEIIGNCHDKTSILMLSNMLFCMITEYVMVNEKEDLDLIDDINRLKNLLDRINYYM